MNLLFIITTLIFLAELAIRPRLDYTGDKKLLLWYGKKNRNYIQII